MCEEEKVMEMTEEAEEISEETAAAENDQKDDEIAAYRDKLLRLTAEFDNFRKRTVKEKESLFADGKADTVLAFLPLADNLERFSEAVQDEPDDNPLKQGLEKVIKQLSDIFKELSVEEIPAVGETFDPNMHNAVMHIEDDTIDEQTIVEQFQKGYKIGDKVLRFSMVKVAN